MMQCYLVLNVLTLSDTFHAADISLKNFKVSALTKLPLIGRAAWHETATRTHAHTHISN